MVGVCLWHQTLRCIPCNAVTVIACAFELCEKHPIPLCHSQADLVTGCVTDPLVLCDIDASQAAEAAAKKSLKQEDVKAIADIVEEVTEDITPAIENVLPNADVARAHGVNADRCSQLLGAARHRRAGGSIASVAASEAALDAALEAVYPKSPEEGKEGAGRAGLRELLQLPILAWQHFSSEKLLPPYQLCLPYLTPLSN